MMKKALLTIFLFASVLWMQAQTGCAFYVEPGGGITFCNNIIINNGDSNINVSVGSNNLVTDSAGVFNNNLNNFTLSVHSPALDIGSNSCIGWSLDMNNKTRISNGRVDLGAFEHFISPSTISYTVFQKNSGVLQLCNNIIVNNPSHHDVFNGLPLSATNICSDSIPIFKNSILDFSPLSSSPAVNSGSNICNTLSQDLSGNNRIQQTVIDKGAFESNTSDNLISGHYAVHQTANGILSLCNNIIVNHNVWLGNTNIVGYPPNNLVLNNDSLLTDNINDYRPREGSIAIDQGLNDCSSANMDLAGNERIAGTAIDIGAFEQSVSDSTSSSLRYVIYGKGHHQLQLCNNIVINNPSHDLSSNIASLEGNNYTNESSPVFRDPIYDFRPLEQSDVVNAGTNSCAAWAFDLEKEKRISGDAIEFGAFEIPTYEDVVETDSTYYPGGDSVVPPGGHGYIVIGGNVIGGHGIGHGSGHSYLCNATVCAYRNSSFELCNNIISNNSIYTYNVFQQDSINTVNNIVIDEDSIFTDNINNYYPLPYSRAVDQGENSCNTVLTDLAKHSRIFNDIIDIGAYEQYDPNMEGLDSSCVIFQQNGKRLQLCNNIIVNNPTHTQIINTSVIAPSNILSDSIPIFKNSIIDFSLLSVSPAINKGENSCSTWAVDINGAARIYQDTIDVGAFEQDIEVFQTFDTTNTVLQSTDTSTIYLCNNIIINNSIWTRNTNVEASPDNIITDNDSVFTDNINDYQVRENSIAINRGNNDCNVVAVDLARHNRIMADTIDIGAFEVYRDDELTGPDCFTIYQIDSLGLILCNNIIVNNPRHTDQTNILLTDNHNLIADSADIFRNSQIDFIPITSSIVVNSGNNECCPLSQDLESNVRIVDSIIDMGAFEQTKSAVEFDTTSIVTRSDSSDLYLCNNIIINNCIWAHNFDTPTEFSHNILTDNDSLFIDNINNYQPGDHSIAINAGDNTCNVSEVDLKNRPRINDETIEVGAYEIHVQEENNYDITHYTIYQTDTTHSHRLELYNNIVIYNDSSWMRPSNEIAIDEHNMLQDQPNVFVDELSDFSLMQGSPAINAGDNSRVHWDKDLKDDVRISCAAIVDLGAYEYDFSDIEVSIVSSEVSADNCMDSYIVLTAISNAPHFHWGHTNVDTNVIHVMPLTPTTYTVTASNEGGCFNTSSLLVMPSLTGTDTVDITTNQPSSTGKTFWVSYLKNHFRTPTLSLIVSAEQATTGTVTNPQTGWSTTFAVGNHTTTTIAIPAAQAYSADADVVSNFGLVIDADDTISLCAANYNVNSFDASNVFPANSLKSDYLLQTYTPTTNAEFVIVATENNTTVEITPTKILQGGHPAYSTFSVTLQKGQTYLGMSAYGGARGDLSGTFIHALDDKKIAVFNGNVCANVPTQNSYTDHLYEQAVPVSYWGKTFAITSSAEQNFDVVRVTAQRNNTQLRRNGSYLTTLNAQQTYEFQLSATDGSCYLESTEPVGTYLYIAGALQGNDREESDPSMIWISPIEQQAFDIVFSTFQTADISNHYVNIVAPSLSISNIRLDNESIASSFAPVNGNPALSFARISIPDGVHRLISEDGFIAHVYGLGYHESYGYAIGSVAVPLDDQLLVNGQPSQEMSPNQHFCPYENIVFSTLVNYECDSIVWDFGDESPLLNGLEVSHNYVNPGTYLVSATLYIEQNGVTYCSSLYAGINITEGELYTYYDTVCQGYHYIDYGFDVYANTAGENTYTRQEGAEGSNCGSNYILNLFVYENIQTIFDTICVHNLYVNHGFNIYADTVGNISDTISFANTQTGCDSLLILELTVTPSIEIISQIEGNNMPRVGYTYTYAIDSLINLQYITWSVDGPAVITLGQGSNQISVDFINDADSVVITLTGHNACGEIFTSKTVHPQSDRFVQISDTICDNETVYNKYGFYIEDPSFENNIFTHNDTTSLGIDSSTVLTLFFNQTFLIDLFDTICQGDVYTDNGFHITSDFTMALHDIVDTLHATSLQTGCDSTVILTLTIIETTADELNLTVIENDLPYILNSNQYDSTGTYVQHLTNAAGCDSTLTLNLTVHRNQTTYLDSTICADALPLTWNGLTFNEAGTQSALLTASTGADSTLVMTLTVNALTAEMLNVTLIENDLPYILNGTSYDSAGTYVQHLTNADGCDSTLTLNLTVHSNQTTYLDSTICADALPLTWNGVTFNAAGTQSALLTASTGADSTVVMTLTVNALTTETLNVTVLGNDLPYILNGTSYDSAGTYVQHLTNAAGCDSTLTLNLTVHSNQTTYLDSTICADALPLTWNGITFTAAGTQTADLTASTGADSTVVMTLTVNALTAETLNITVIENNLPYLLNGTSYDSAGTYVQHLTNAASCDSTLTLNLTVHRNQTTYLDSAICADELPLVWNGLTFNAAGTRTALLTASTGADSTVVMTLTVNALTAETLNVTVIENDLPYILNGTSFDTTGTYIQHLTNAAGCDSTLTLNLTVYRNVTAAADSTICADALPLTWNGVTFYEAGTQSALLTASTGADSTVVMTLTVNAPTTETLNVTIIENDLPYILDGTSYDSAGTYVQHLTNAAGCDSTLILNLTVHRNQTTYLDSAICADELPLVWNGLTFNAAGTQNIIHTASSGTDSTVVMTLTVHELTTETLNITVIENNLPYILNGTSYNDDGTYIQHLTNAAGCDSTLTLNLTVYRNVTAAADSSICADALPLHWNGVTFNAAGTQSALLTASTGADSTVVMTLTVNTLTTETLNITVIENDLPYILNGTSYDSAGTYVQHFTNAAGCDSTLTLNLTVHWNQTTYLDSTICADALPLLWNGVTFYAAGTQNIIHTAYAGADSTVVMTLTVHELTTETLNITVIENNLPYILNGTSYNNDGTYVQHLTNAAGCDSTLTLNLTVYRNVTAAADSSICADALPLTWNGITFNAAGTRTITLTAHSGIDSILTMTLHVNPMPRITANLTNINCHGDSTGIIAASVLQDTQPYTYLWTQGQAVVGTSATIADLAAGTYLLHVSDAHGCEADSSFTLVSLHAHTHDTVTAIVCQGEPFDEMGFHIPTDSTMVTHIIVETVYTPSLLTGCDSVVTLLLTVNPAYHFNEELTLCDYDLPFAFRGTTIEGGVPAHSTIDFTYTTANGCDSVFTLDLTVIETDLEIISSTDFCEEMQSELIAQSDLENYHWSTGEETNHIHITAPGNYSVTAATGSCEATALISIPECELNLYLPNAITPGYQDGLNDVFSIPEWTKNMISDNGFEICIFNRWGEMVYYSSDKNFKWNGEINGTIYRNNIYNYSLRYRNTTGRKFLQKGSITVL